MIEKIEDCLNLLNALEENTSKQSGFSAPDAAQVLNQLSGFMEKGLDFLIRTLGEVRDQLEEE